MKPIQQGNATVYQCEICGFGYEDSETAEGCESFCKTHNSCSFTITKKAVYKPDA